MHGEKMDYFGKFGEGLLLYTYESFAREAMKHSKVQANNKHNTKEP